VDGRVGLVCRGLTSTGWAHVGRGVGCAGGDLRDVVHAVSVPVALQSAD
jgi:hypothetical protein